MATRIDINVNYNADPRLITVDAPSAEVTIQDLHDTLSSIDDDFSSMSFPHTLTTTGKQDLGGGVLVGLTLQLENTQLSFERRTTKVSTGTITTAGIIGTFFQTVIDSPGGAFVTDGVSRGDIVENVTDGSFAEVVSIDSETQLTVLSPTGGTDNDYDIGESYVVWLHETCNISGGNLVAVEADGLTILEPTHPTFGVGIVRTSSSSATLIEQTDIQFAAFNGFVCVDVINGISGTDYPTGTRRQPVDNLTDAAAIAVFRGLNKLSIIGDITVSTEADWTDFILEGENPSRSTITFLVGATTVGIEVLHATVAGTISGAGIEIDESILDDLTVHSGLFIQCGISGTLTFTGGSADIARLNDCYGAAKGLAFPPTIDLGGDGPLFTITRYSGSLILDNKTGAAPTGVAMNGGTLTLNVTLTAGTIFASGQADLTDNSSGATVIDVMLTTDQGIVDTLDVNTYDGRAFDAIMADLLSMASGRIVEGPTGTYKFYERDNSTVRFTLVETAAERNRI